jgi:acetylornithine deacetylase/succinyl-diaminopimelate desuccinylase-like protein
LHNTVSPTILHASEKCNVIPSEVTVELDGRLLPGYTFDDLKAELSELLGDEVEFSVVFYEPGPPETDMGLFDTLSEILSEMDPEGTPVPLLLSAVTDARLFARLGIQTYGFTPMQLSPGFDFWNVIHAADERIPIVALDFGADAIYRLLQRFGEAS